MTTGTASLILLWQTPGQPVLVASAALIGLCIGSFVATLTARWTEGRSAVLPRSACDGCGKRLGAAELVPVLSYVLLRGRCRTCGNPIGPRYPAIELTAAMLGGLAFAVAGGTGAAFGALFGWMLLALAILDAERFWLPDRLTAPLAALGLAGGALGLTPPLGDRVIGAAIGFGGLSLIAIAYRRVRGREGLGGGDPKLLGAIGAGLGWQPLPFVLLLAALLGLGFALVQTIRGDQVNATTRVPLGALMAVAAWVLWLVT
jgi:leader peptidase (prepilin peptidase)/N-methyltransferase